MQCGSFVALFAQTKENVSFITEHPRMLVSKKGIQKLSLNKRPDEYFRGYAFRGYTCSEWHSFFDCPACEEPRHIFIDTFPRFHNLFYPGYETEEQFSGFIEASPQQPFDQPNYKLESTRLAKIIHDARFNRYLTNELSRFIINIHVCRRRVFRSLSTNRPHSPLDGALRSRHLDALEF